MFRRSRIASPWRDTLILRRSIPVCLCLLLFVGCAPEERSPTPDPNPPATADSRWLISVLAADSLEGRRAGSEGSRIAARLIAEQFKLAGLEAAGDSGYFQRIPLRIVTRSNGRSRPTLSSWSSFDSLPPAERTVETNVIGLVRGSDPELAGEYVLVTAHFDHVGIGRPVQGDSIYNGADDDASGVAALVEIARALKEEARLLVMDEPTAALADHEIEALFEVIRGLCREGVPVIYISHRMREIFAIGDRVTVMRDGRVTGVAMRGRRRRGRAWFK